MIGRHKAGSEIHLQMDFTRYNPESLVKCILETSAELNVGVSDVLQVIEEDGKKYIIEGIVSKCPQTDVCLFSIDTLSWGSRDIEEDIYNASISCDKLYSEALSRGICIVGKSISIICNEVQQHSPSLNWLRENTILYGRIPYEMQRYVDRYTSYDFAIINAELRKHPEKHHPIDSVIDRMNPLEKDVVVYRYISHNIPEGSYLSTGFLSTSMSSALILGVVDKGGRSKRKMMIIRVPKGTKALFVPSWEYELILPRNITINIEHDMKSLMYVKNRNVVTVDTPVYNSEIVSDER